MKTWILKIKRDFFPVMKHLFVGNFVHSNPLAWGIFLPIRIVFLGEIDIVLARNFRELGRFGTAMKKTYHFARVVHRRHMECRGRQTLKVERLWKNQAEEQWWARLLQQMSSFIKRQTDHPHMLVCAQHPIVMMKRRLAWMSIWQRYHHTLLQNNM